MTRAKGDQRDDGDDAGAALLLERDLPTVMGRMDWERVRTAMLALDWRWVDPAARMGKVPTIDELKASAEESLRKAIAGYRECGTWSSVRSGGFRARASKDELLLAFEIASADSWEHE